MPYRRPYGRKRYYRRRTYRKSSGNSWGSIAKKALSTAMFVKNLVNAETKNYITSWTMTTGGPLAATQVLNQIPQGDSSSQRNGDSVKNKSLVIRGDISANRTQAGDWTNNVRVLLIKMKNAQTAPLLSEIFKDPSSIHSPRHPNYMKQYKIIHDKIYTLDKQRLLKNIKWSFPLKSHTEYTGTSGGMTSNAYYMLFQSDTSGSVFPTFTFTSNLTYLDN